MIKKVTHPSMQDLPPLKDCVAKTIDDYFAHLDGEPPQALHQFVLAEVEEVLIKVVMHYAKQNQSKAKHWLGISRTTLRKKLEQYNLLSSSLEEVIT